MANGKMALWSTLENIKKKLDNDSQALSKTFVAFAGAGIEKAGGHK